MAKSCEVRKSLPQAWLLDFPNPCHIPGSMVNLDRAVASRAIDMSIAEVLTAGRLTTKQIR